MSEIVISGYGYGYGYGDGYGQGNSCGSGYGYGYGDGYGDNRGPGYGSGYGDGYGEGYGDGSGCGYGCNCDGYGYKIGVVDSREVRLLYPWRYVTVGCQCHSITWWRDNWRSVEAKERVSISEAQVEEMLCKATLCAAEQTDER